MSVFVLAMVTINEAEPHALSKYLEATMPLLDEVGGKLLQRFTVNEVVVGSRPAHSVTPSPRFRRVLVPTLGALPRHADHKGATS